MSQKVFSLASVVMSLVVFSPLSARADTWSPDLLDPAVRFTVLPSFISLLMDPPEGGCGANRDRTGDLLNAI
jgi:hypothetical protein